MRGKLASTFAIAALLALPAMPPGARAAVPPEFFGMSPQGALEPTDLELMREAGVHSMRLPMLWNEIERFSPFLAQPDWGEYDREVSLAAEQGIRVFPFICSSPSWVAVVPRAEPAGRRQLLAWAAFLRAAERRYGPEGTFWRYHRELPYLPIRDWEIWNEENIVTFARKPSPERYAQLLRLSGRVLHREDPGSKVILGGLFGRPLQIPPNVGSGDFLSRLYRSRPIKPYFDGVALHPYVADAGAMRAQIRNLRRVMRVHHDAATPLYMTELGWGSASYESRWERGPYGQARELDQAFAMLTGHRRSWRIGGVWWFSWTDAYGVCQFCDSAGLLTINREAKPSWYRFNAWTGGDADTVPRASFAPGD